MKTIPRVCDAEKDNSGGANMNKESKKNYKGVILPLIFLVAVSALGRFTGLFRSLGALITVSFDNIIEAIIALIFVILLKNVLLKVLSIFHEKIGRTGTMVTLATSLTKYAMALLAFCWILSIIGVNVSTIFASIGIIALILGFGAESLVADLVTGVFILFENEYNVGDIIEVDGFRGTVKSVGIRTLSLEDSGGNVKIINNSDLKNIINRSENASYAISDIGISYGTDLEALDPIIEEILAEIKKKHPDMFTGDIKCLGVETLGDSSITLRFRAEVKETDVFSGRRLLNRELKIAFDKKNIVIPFPQLDVHTS